MIGRGRQANGAIDKTYKYYNYKTSVIDALEAMRKKKMKGSCFAQVCKQIIAL